MVNVIVQSGGTSGPRGNSVLNGAGAPTSTVGIDGDFYIDTDANNLYGPRVNGAWPGASVHIGAAGALIAANNLSDLASAATARTSLGLGSAATQASSAFDTAGAASAAQSAAIADAASKYVPATGGSFSGDVTVEGYTTMVGAQTNGDFTIFGHLAAEGMVGFTGATPIARQPISGSRSDGTALANLLTALAAFGLITDNTT